jgi:DUF3102 family protein
MPDYGDLKISELVTLINTEYAAILEADRTNLQRALKVGEMLVDLKPRVAKHGEWQLWLKSHCPKISIETANLYMRLADNLEELEKRAAAKSVTLTDLTITQARELLAKPKPTNGNGSDKAKANKVAKAAVEPGNKPDTRTEEAIGREWLKALEVDELVGWLKEIHRNNTGYLQELSAAVTRELRPTALGVAVGAEKRM